MNRIAPIALLTLAGALTARGADPAADEVKKLQGEWQAVEVEVRGKKAGKDDPAVANMRLVFAGDRITLPDPTGGGKDRKKAFSVAPARSPKAMDMASLDGQEEGQTAACIYKLDGDRLTICLPYFTADPSRRPKEFKAGAGDGLMLITLERVKPK